MQNPDRYRSRAWFEQRIEVLNQRHVTTVAEMNAVMREMTDLTREMARATIVSRIVDCFTRLIEGTPVDTGRLRAGWMIDTNPNEGVPEERDYSEYKEDAGIESAVAAILPPELTRADVIYIINNVEYVLIMNAGWSKTASHAGFIDLFLLELKTQLELAARDFSEMRA